MLKLLRDVAIVWGVKKDEPHLKAERELHRSDLELLEAQHALEFAEFEVGLLKARASRLGKRVSVGNRLDAKIERQLAKTRIELMEREGRAEELGARVVMLQDRMARLETHVLEDRAIFATV